MAIYKKKNKYYCRFQIDGERHHFLCAGATTEKDARKLEAQFMYKVQQEQNGIKKVVVNKVKLATLLDLFENYSKLNKKSYITDLRLLAIARPYFKDIFAQDITVKKLEDFKAYLLNARKLKNSTVNRYMSLLSKTFNIGIANKLVTENPVSLLTKLKENNYKIRFLSKEEETRLFQALPSYLIPIVTTALQTGMRKSEILNLKWNQIDFEYNFIELLETKSGKARKIPISSKLLETLNSLPHLTEHVFTNPITLKPYNCIKRAWHSALKRANIENFRFHDLRHTVATRLVESNIDLIVVKEILGHAQLSTTQRYAHPVPIRKAKAIEILNTYN